MSLEQNAKSIDIAFLALLDQFFEVGHFITALEKIDMKTDLYSATSPWVRSHGLELGSSWNGEESIMFFYCIPLKELEEFCGGCYRLQGIFCACIPYGQLTHSGMLCTCLWDIQLNLPKGGQLLQEKYQRMSGASWVCWSLKSGNPLNIYEVINVSPGLKSGQTDFSW